MILGSVDNCGKILGIVVCIWGNEEVKYVKIVFMGNKVVIFNYEGLE